MKIGLIVGVLVIILVFLMAIGLCASSGDTQTDTPKTTTTVTPKPEFKIYSGDSGTWYQSTPDGAIEIFNVTKNWRTHNIPITKDKITGLELTDNDTRLLITTSNEKYWMNLTSHQVYLLTPTPQPSMITTPSIIPTPIVTPTVQPTPDITGMERYVVIITPTPVPVEPNLTVNVGLRERFLAKGEPILADGYIATNDAPIKKVLITLSFRLGTYNEWVEQGFYTLPYNLNLPAHAKKSFDINEINNGNPINTPYSWPDGTRVYEGVYKVDIRITNPETGKTIGETSINNVQVGSIKNGLRVFNNEI